MNTFKINLKSKGIIKKIVATLFVAYSLILTLQAQNFSIQYDTWYFHNFGTATLSWDDFRETFIGIAPTEAESGNFDPLFYEFIYKNKLAGPGNCFGMSLLALEMKQSGGCEGFCYPPYLYPGLCESPGGPSQPELLHAINVVHGHQINHRVIMYILDLFAQNKQRDGNYVYSQFQYYMSKNDPCVISITKDWAPGSDGHALIAYNSVDEGSKKKIYIYDPNRSYYASGIADYYNTLQNYIEINSSTGAWLFTMADGVAWSGSPASGGNLVLFPVSIVGPRDRLPQSLFADISEAVDKILIYGEGTDVNQVSTPDGRHLFKPGTRQMETDVAKKIKNLLPFNPFAGGMQTTQNNQIMLFYRGNESLDIDVKSTGKGYTFSMIGSKGYVSVSTGNGIGTEKIRVDGINTVSPKISFANKTHSSDYKVELKAIVKENDKVMNYTIEKMKPTVNSPIKIMITGEGSGIEMISDKNVPQFDLSVSERGKEKYSPAKQTILLEQGKAARFSVAKSTKRKELQIKKVGL